MTFGAAPVPIFCRAQSASIMPITAIPQRVTINLSKTAQTGGDASGDRLSSIESVFGARSTTA